MREREEKRGPLYAKVNGLIRSDIASGALIGQLPSMDKLGLKYGASKVTVNKVLIELKEEGLVNIRQGLGSFVNISGKFHENATKDSKSELTDTFTKAVNRYSQFLTDDKIPKEIKAAMIQVVDTQINLVGQIQGPTNYSH